LCVTPYLGRNTSEDIYLPEEERKRQTQLQ
jgi:hypothetical protein